MSSLAMNEERLIVATGEGLCLWRLKDVMGGDVRPCQYYHTDLRHRHTIFSRPISHPTYSTSFPTLHLHRPPTRWPDT